MNKKKLICTYFDENYLPRGLALIDSIYNNNDNVQLVVLCLDTNTYNFLKNKYDSLTLIKLEDYISFFNIDQSRFANRKEFYFSITPNLCIMVLDRHPEFENLLYLDSDIYVYGDLDVLYKEFENYSIAACSHRHTKLYNLFSNDFGIFNVGVNLFKNDVVGRKCLEHWKRSCDEWYPNKEGYPLSFFSDQIFLNEWPELFKNKFKEIENIGVNVAPWNAINYKIKHKENIFFVNESPLIIYHFSSLVKIDDNKWNVNDGLAFFTLNKVLSELYSSYIGQIESYNLKIDKYAKLNTKMSKKKKIFQILSNIFFKNIITIKTL
tara:strand:- start:5671 stop:6636 length:966 start_codon:yes stop_codon:yes gene_type:complete